MNKQKAEANNLGFLFVSRHPSRNRRMLIHEHPHVEPLHVVTLGHAHALTGAFASDALRFKPERARYGPTNGLANERELLAAGGGRAFV